MGSGRWLVSGTLNAALEFSTSQFKLNIASIQPRLPMLNAGLQNLLF